MLAKGLAAAKRSVDDILREGLKPGLSRPVFYPVGGGWRSLAKAHIESVGAPVKVVHGYTLAAPATRSSTSAASRQGARPPRSDARSRGEPGRGQAQNELREFSR